MDWKRAVWLELGTFQLTHFVGNSKYKSWKATIAFEYHKFNLSVNVCAIVVTWGAVF